jgi:hypothetical protein
MTETETTKRINLTMDELAKAQELASASLVEISGVKVPPFDRVACSGDVVRELLGAAEPAEPNASGSAFTELLVEVDDRLPPSTIFFRRGHNVVAVWHGGAGGGGFLIL